MKTFRVGDRVRFRSGGPVMSIKDVSADGESITCEIIEAGRAAEVGPYPFDILILEAAPDNKSTDGENPIKTPHP